MEDADKHASLVNQIPMEPIRVFPYSSPSKRYEISLFKLTCEGEEDILLTEEGQMEMYGARWRPVSEFIKNLKADTEAGPSSQMYAKAVEGAILRMAR